MDKRAIAFLLTVPEFEEVLEDKLRQILKDTLPSMLEGLRKPYLNKKELQDLTGWSSRQVEYKKQKGEIPFIRRGRLILFPTIEVHAYLEKGRVPAIKRGQNNE